MQNVTIRRYAQPEAVGYAGYVEPEDGSWILFIPTGRDAPSLWLRANGVQGGGLKRAIVAGLLALAMLIPGAALADESCAICSTVPAERACGPRPKETPTATCEADERPAWVCAPVPCDVGYCQYACSGCGWRPGCAKAPKRKR